MAIAPGVLRFEDASLVDFLSESEGVGGGVCVCVWGGGVIFLPFAFCQMEHFALNAKAQQHSSTPLVYVNQISRIWVKSPESRRAKLASFWSSNGHFEDTCAPWIMVFLYIK